MKGGKLETSPVVFATFFLMALSGVPLVVDSSTSAAASPAAASNSTATGMALSGVQATSGTVSSSPHQIVLSSFNAGAGSDRLLVVGVEANDYAVAAITFGGSQLTQAVGSFVNNDAEFWYLAGPIGAADIVVTMAGPTSVVVGAYSFSGVNQTDPIPTSATDYATAASSPTVSISTKYPNSWVLDSPSIYGGVTLGSPTCAQQWDLRAPGAITGASSSTVAPSPSTTTCSWAASSGDSWDDVAIEMKASASSSTTSSTTSTTSTTTTTTAAHSSPPGKRFIRIRALNAHSAWALPGYDAQQVLAMIGQLKPDALERYTNGVQNPNAEVPVAPGSPPMTAGEFLNESMRACNCYIIPGVSLAQYDQGTLFTTSRALLGLPVYPKIAYLSLDKWHAFSTNHTQEQVQGMFQRLYSQGWAGVGVNANGGYFPTYGYATFTDFRISPSNWQPDSANLAAARQEPNIKLALLYIDFPRPMDQFAALSPDQEAQILTNNIASAQSSDGFYFVYPIVQSFWDSNNHTTSSGGHYQGETIYTVMLQLMQQYN